MRGVPAHVCPRDFCRVGIRARPAHAAPLPVTRFTIGGVSDQMLNGAPTLTPDGSRIVYVDAGDPNRSLYVRPLDSLRSRMLPGTEGAVGPFPSPDGKWVGFFAGNKVKKVLLDGSASAVTLGDAPLLARGSWSSNDLIVMSGRRGEGLVWIAAGGGPIHELTTLDSAAGEASHEYPFVLPGGRSVIFTVADGEKRALAIVSLDPSASHPARHTLLGQPGWAEGLRDGWLLVRNNALAAIRYDATQRRLSGAPVTVLDDPEGDVGSASVAADGTLLYTRALSGDVVIVDGQGIARPLLGPTPPGAGVTGRTLMGPAVSPDGKRLLLQISDARGQNIWLYDLASHTPTRLTANGGIFGSEWAPDGRRLIYSTNDGTMSGVWLIAADGRSPPEKLLEAPGLIWSTLTPDGRTLVFQRVINKVWSLWTMPLDSTRRAPVPLLREAFSDYMPHISPDGHWIAYVSGASDREEVVIRPFPGPGAPVQVSDGGGTEPMWAPDGRGLFYRHGRAGRGVDQDGGRPRRHGAQGPVRGRIRRWNAAHQLFGHARRPALCDGIGGTGGDGRGRGSELGGRDGREGGAGAIELA